MPKKRPKKPDLGTTNVCKMTFLFADAALLNMKLPDAAVGLASATVTAAEQGLGLAHQGLEQVWLLTQFFSAFFERNN